MRKPNFKLNNLKLQQKQLQLAQIEAQLNDLKLKQDAVTERLIAKQLEIETMKDLLSDRKSTRLNSSHMSESRMPSSA